MRSLFRFVLLIGVSASAYAQWQVLDAHATADFRGVHYVGDGVAWVSGTNGTVLRTVDMGKTWTHCAVPPGAEKLDFRGVQAFDAKTAIVMSSGAGDQSRLYKTVDGCATWKLVATNPDKAGFWDSVKTYDEGNMHSGSDPEEVLILGDSVNGNPKVWEWKEGWDERELEPSYRVSGLVPTGESSFAASNSVLEVATTPQVDKTWKWNFRWASGTPAHSFISYTRAENSATCEPCRTETRRAEVPMATGSPSAGIFSFHFRTELIGVAVGGDYQKADSQDKTAAFSIDGGLSWKVATTMAQGYRSAVAYDERTNVWIAVGPNGTDVSIDDGRQWRALKPSVSDAADADKNWNALSLPFVVGPHGRIGLLRESALAGLSGGKDGARTPGTRK